MFDLKKIKYKSLGHFRFKELNGKFLLTNDVGEHVFLTEDEFKNFTEGKLDKKGKTYKELAKKSFVKGKIDIEKVSDKYAKKNHFLFSGPSLHIFVVTLRCNNKCIYCHASAQGMEGKDLDMNVETAEKALELVFKSPNKYISIEFQGGEPLVNWSVVKFIIEEARKRNRKFKKNLEIRIVSNFTLMTDEKLRYLLKNKVGLSSSLDGPETVHNKNRPSTAGNSYKMTTQWIKKINKNALNGKDKKEYVNSYCMATITRDSLSFGKEIVNEFVSLKFDGIYLRPMYLLGRVNTNYDKIGYGSREYLDFFRDTMDYIISLNLKGRYFNEKGAKFFLEKIFSEQDPNMLDNQSPCGGGGREFSYNHNGNVYTCDLGRSLSATGSENFKVGDVNDKYSQLIDNSVIKSMCSSSCLIGLPECNDCAYMPFCGVCPVQNYAETGNIFSQMPNNERCKISKGILDYLFEKMQDEKVLKIFKSWINQ